LETEDHECGAGHDDTQRLLRIKVAEGVDAPAADRHQGEHEADHDGGGSRQETYFKTQNIAQTRDQRIRR
jgi:hypothetical protein